MQMAELLAQLRQLSKDVPALAELLRSVPKQKRVKPLRARNIAELFLYRPASRADRPQLNKRERHLSAERYRESVDACAEREGIAIERLRRRVSVGRALLERTVARSVDDMSAHRIVRRFSGANKGDVLSAWHYVRALAKSLDIDVLDGEKGARLKRGRLSLVLRQHDYRRGAARKQWAKACEWFRAVVQYGSESAALASGHRKPVNRVPGWARATQETAETRARRQLQKQWRLIVRAVGAAKVQGIDGAADLYAMISTMRP